MIELVVVDLDLPLDLPFPPENIDQDPGMRDRRYHLEGSRRPCGRLHPPKWAARVWTERNGSLSQEYRGALNALWLSAPQCLLWLRQVHCEYCGAGVGVPCIARSVRWGTVGLDGLPQSSSRPIEDRHHAARQKATNRLAWKVPAALFPSWVWWATHAIGQDDEALVLALNVVRGTKWTADYLGSLGAR